MSRFDVEATIERDAQGRIESAGATWAETRPVLDQWMLVLGSMGAFAAVAGMIWLMVGGTMNPLLLLGVPAVAISILMLRKLPGRPRGVTFMRDGKIQLPHGMYYRQSLTELDGHHRNVASIEARQQRQQPDQNAHLFEVMMLSTGGDLICISRNLPEWSALKAAAQLTHLLNRMRGERSDKVDDEAGGAWVTLN